MKINSFRYQVNATRGFADSKTCHSDQGILRPSAIRVVRHANRIYKPDRRIPRSVYHYAGAMLEWYSGQADLVGYDDD